MNTWLIDTALFKSSAPGASKRSTLRGWIEAHEDPVFLSVASLVELEAAIRRSRTKQRERANSLQVWIDGLVSTFGDRIHSVDAEVALRAGRLMSSCQAGYARHCFHDAVLVATAQVYGHGLLTKRDGVFGAWTGVRVASP